MLDDKYQKAFRLVFSSEQGESSAAVEALRSMHARAKVAPSELTVVHARELNGQLYEQRLRLQAQVEAQGEQLAFLRSRSAERVSLGEALRWLDARTAKVDRWPQLRDLAQRRLFGGRWPEEREVYKTLASRLNVTPDEVRAWRDGSKEAPEAAVRLLEAAQPGAKLKPAVRRAATKTGKIWFGETELPQAEHAVLQALLAAGGTGLNGRELEQITKIKAKTITGRLSFLKSVGLAEGAGIAGYWRPTSRAVVMAGQAQVA